MWFFICLIPHFQELLDDCDYHLMLSRSWTVVLSDCLAVKICLLQLETKLMRAVRLNQQQKKIFCQNYELKDDTTLCRTGGKCSQRFKFFLNYY